MASVVTSGDYPFLPLFAEKAGFDLSKVTRIQVDNKVRDRLLPEGKVDAISGFASSAMPSYAATGVNAHFMLFSDYGILGHHRHDAVGARRPGARIVRLLSMGSCKA